MPSGPFSGSGDRDIEDMTREREQHFEAARADVVEYGKKTGNERLIQLSAPQEKIWMGLEIELNTVIYEIATQVGSIQILGRRKLHDDY